MRAVRLVTDGLPDGGIVDWRRRAEDTDVPALIRLKRAAGRGKDREVLAELEALLEESDRD